MRNEIGPELDRAEPPAPASRRVCQPYASVLSARTVLDLTPPGLPLQRRCAHTAASLLYVRHRSARSQRYARLDAVMDRHELPPCLDSMRRQTIPTRTTTGRCTCDNSTRTAAVTGRRPSHVPSSPSPSSARGAAVALCALVPLVSMGVSAGHVPLHRTQKPHVRGHHRHRELLDRCVTTERRCAGTRIHDRPHTRPPRTSQSHRTRQHAQTHHHRHSPADHCATHHASPCLIMPHHASPCLTMPHHAAPCRAMPPIGPQY
jgi:hypothetical protein